MSEKVLSLADALMPECPRCKEPTERKRGTVGYEPERIPTRMTKDGKVIPGKNVAVRKRLWQCLKCGKVYAVPEAEVKEKRARTKTAGRKRRAGKSTRAVANAK